MSQSNYNKYIKYALGEVLLIIIGVIVALQLNIWNEKRKARKNEIMTLKELLVDLEENKRDILGNINGYQRSQRSIGILIDHLESGKPFHDSLSHHFVNIYPFALLNGSQTTFEKLKANGLELISNPSIRTKLTALYSAEFRFVSYLEQTYFNEHYTNYLKPMIIREFETFEAGESMKPRDYNAFRKNPQNLQTLRFSLGSNDIFLFRMDGLLKDIEALRSEVEIEISQSKYADD